MFIYHMLVVLERLLCINLEYAEVSFKNHFKWGSSITREEIKVVDDLLQVTCFKMTLWCIITHTGSQYQSLP